MLLVDELLHRGGHAARDGKAAPGAGALVKVRAVGQLGKVDVPGLKNAHQLLVGQDEVDVGPDIILHGLELFGRARADEDDLAVGPFALDEPRGIDHRRVGHGNVAGFGGEQPSGHHPPRRAAGGRHEPLLLRDLFHKVPRFLDRADIRADRDLDHIGKAELLHGREELRHGHVLAELADERRRDDGHDLVALEHGADDLIDLALVDDRAERAAHEALAAGDAAVIVDAGLAIFVDADGVHAAGGLTRALEVGDGVVRTGSGAFAALDAELLVDAALAVDKFDRALRAHALARGGEAALTQLVDTVLPRRAGVAGVGDDVDERRLVILLGDGGLIHALGQKRARLHGLEGQTHGQPHALAGDGALEKHGLAVQRALAGDDLEGDILHIGVVAGVCHPGDLGEDFFSDLCDQRRDSAHDNLLLLHILATV